MTRVLREGGGHVKNVVIGALTVTAVVVFWVAARADNRADAAAKALEASELVLKKQTVALDKTKAELAELADPELVKAVLEAAPDAEVTSVVEFATERAEVPLDVIVDVDWDEWFNQWSSADIEWYEVEDDGTETPIELEPDEVAGMLEEVRCDFDSLDETLGIGVTGEIDTLETKKGNTIVTGKAQAWGCDNDEENCPSDPPVAGDVVLAELPFKWDATKAYKLATKSENVKRWWVGGNYGLLSDSTRLGSICDYWCSTLELDPTRFSFDGGRIFFPRKRFSVGLGAFAKSDQLGGRVMVLF